MLVAVHISNYKKKPVIGKVIEVCDHEIKLHYWKGTYSTAWQPHMVKCNKDRDKALDRQFTKTYTQSSFVLLNLTRTTNFLKTQGDI